MKRLSVLLAAYVASIALVGCDSSTNPAPITVHDTTTKIVYYNDPFAKTSALVHGQWSLVAGTDTATATLFQDTTQVSATIQWKNGTVWMLSSTKLTKDSLVLENTAQKLYMWARFSDSASHKITGMSGTYFNLSNPAAGNPSWKAKRTL